MTQIYNDPNGSPSSIGTQFNTSYWDRRSMIDAAEQMFFSPLADVRSMPKHYGKELKLYYYIPLLDDLNVNDQGLDAAGVVTATTEVWVTFPRLVMEILDADAASAIVNVDDNVSGVTMTEGADGSGVSGAGWTEITVTALQAKYLTTTESDLVIAESFGATAQQAGGNIYGSSQDVGTISARMPTLTETGGRVNRVGFTRLERSGTIQEHGFFTEFTEDSLMFDTDSELYGHMSRELVAGANEVTEDLLQIDILNAAGTIMFAGTATADNEISGETGAAQAVVDYADLKRLSIALDDNRTPKNTKIIKGSRMIDTRTVNAARLMYIGSDLQTTVENMVDGLSNAAYKPVREYAAAGSILNGEIGAVGDFRIIVVPNMMNWKGAGADDGTNPGFQVTGQRYDVFPMLVVGGESFATVGLQSSGAKGGKQKFKIIVKKPGKEMATIQDPYGKVGFSSITFYHGFIALRPERIGLVKCVAPE
jgi:N4-gp56 family major capsid protein